MLLESMPLLLGDTSLSEPCMRLSPHTAPGRCLLSSLAGKISGYTYHSVDWFVLMTVAVEQFQVGLLPIFMVSIYVV